MPKLFAGAVRVKDKPQEAEAPPKALRLIAYGVAAACVALIVFWHAVEAPEIDMKQMQMTVGLYDCVWYGGGRSGPRGAHIVDGVPYYNNFTYFFGITPSLCIKELRGRIVRMYYLAPKNTTRRLTLELVDLKSGARWGLTQEQKYLAYENAIANKWIFYLSKLGLLLLALRLTC